MQKSRAVIVILLFLFSVLTAGAITIKVGTLLPEGTEWDEALRNMADEWRTITDGQVRVQIYPGGIAGDEADMVRKMRFNQLDAGVFSAFALRSMVPETFIITLPGLLENDEELDFVLNNWVHRFDGRFREEGFEMLAWSKAGWAYVYGKDPLELPDDLRRTRMAVDNTEAEIASIFKAMGFNVVPTSMTEIMVSLQSGLVNAFYAPPVMSAGLQWFALAPYMTDYRLAPVVAGMVISQRTWQRIPEEYRAECKASMVRVARRFHAESMLLNEQAMSIMSKNGLVQVPVSVENDRQWQEAMTNGHGFLVGDGKSIPQSLYDDLMSQLAIFRAQ